MVFNPLGACKTRMQSAFNTAPCAFVLPQAELDVRLGRRADGRLHGRWDPIAHTDSPATHAPPCAPQAVPGRTQALPQPFLWCNHELVNGPRSACLNLSTLARFLQKSRAEGRRSGSAKQRLPSQDAGVAGYPGAIAAGWGPEPAAPPAPLAPGEAKHPDEPGLCFMSPHMQDVIKTPFFMFNSKYDAWQLGSEFQSNWVTKVCSPPAPAPRRGTAAPHWGSAGTHCGPPNPKSELLPQSQPFRWIPTAKSGLDGAFHRQRSCAGPTGWCLADTKGWRHTTLRRAPVGGRLLRRRAGFELGMVCAVSLPSPSRHRLACCCCATGRAGGRDPVRQGLHGPVRCPASLPRSGHSLTPKDSLLNHCAASLPRSGYSLPKIVLVY